MGKEPDPDEVQALYAGPPDRFVASRNALVARLKDAGDLDEAKRVAALRKPTVAAWAVDSLAHDHARELDALIEVGRHLASAQRGLISGGDAERLRETAAERRRLVERLVRSSEEALEEAGIPAPRATLDKVADTLMAVATDQDAAEKVRRGILDKELPAPAGFGDERLDAALLASVSELPTRSDDAGSAATARAQRRAEESRLRVERLTAEANELEEEAARLERTARDAEATATAAGRSASAARRRADAARRRADDASV